MKVYSFLLIFVSLSLFLTLARLSIKSNKWSFSIDYDIFPRQIFRGTSPKLIFSQRDSFPNCTIRAKLLHISRKPKIATKVHRQAISYLRVVRINLAKIIHFACVKISLAVYIRYFFRLFARFTCDITATGAIQNETSVHFSRCIFREKSREEKERKNRFTVIRISARCFLKRGGSNGVEPRAQPRPETNGNKTRACCRRRRRRRSPTFRRDPFARESVNGGGERTSGELPRPETEGPTERPTDQPTPPPAVAFFLSLSLSCFSSLLSVPTTEGEVKRRRKPKWFSTSTL